MMRAKRPSERGGYTLLEMVIAMTLLSVVMAAVSVVMRTSRESWQAHETDNVRVRTAHATVRHIVRETREATEIVSVTQGTTTNSRLTVRLADGDTLTWQHDALQKRILFTQTSVSNQPSVIAENIETLEFRPGRVDGGVFQASLMDRTQEMTIVVGVVLPRETAVVRRAVGTVWLRAFGRNRTV